MWLGNGSERTVVTRNAVDWQWLADRHDRYHRSKFNCLCADAQVAFDSDLWEAGQAGLLWPGHEVRVAERTVDAAVVKSTRGIKPGTRTALQLLSERLTLSGAIEWCRGIRLEPLSFEAAFVFDQFQELPEAKAMCRHIALMAILVLTMIATASAQDLPPRSIALPGSVNASFGTVGPLEPGNTLGNATFEQGVSLWRRLSNSLQNLNNWNGPTSITRWQDLLITLAG